MNSADIAVGMTIFTIGLFKKVVLADGIAPFASIVFGLARDGGEMNWAVAWIGAVAYSLQLYFDFSGYSDMAIGLGRMFSIRLPINFNSPYKAVNIVDFWRRWHITLSNFLRDYLYISLGGNRHGPMRRYANLMITMLLGGLWHGAGWTFIIWGGLHGLFLVLNHCWDSIFKTEGSPKKVAAWRVWSGRIATFLAVTCAWVFFRAENTTAAFNLLSTMFGIAGRSVEVSAPLWNKLRDAPGLILAYMVIVWLLPNTQQLMGRVRPALRYRYRPDASSWEGRLTSFCNGDRHRPSPSGTEVCLSWLFVRSLASVNSSISISDTANGQKRRSNNAASGVKSHARMRAYCRTLFLTIGVLVGAVALLNWLVDPYHVYAHPVSRNFQAFKRRDHPSRRQGGSRQTRNRTMCCYWAILEWPPGSTPIILP